ncbi:MAG: acyl-CoA dehydrogenase family protein [Acidimicrobiales bacterium]
MDFTISDEHEQFATNLRRYFAERHPVSESRRLFDSPAGFEPRAWRTLADELGAQGLAVPERYGGSGFGYEELAMVFEAAGECLASLPLLSTSGLATPVLVESGDETAQQRYLPRIAAGELVATLALSEGAAGLDRRTTVVTAERHGDRYELRGEARFVIDGATADLVLVPAMTDDGLSVFAVDAPDATVKATPLVTLDLTRRQADLAFDRTPATLVGPEGEAEGLLGHCLRLAVVMLASEQIGGAGRVLEMSSEYAKVRYQFGRPIGSFQAIKHKCADMLVQVETARSAAFYARRVAVRDPEELPVAASLAKAYCSDAYLFCTAQNIQVHGGTGFTWDNDAHLYFRRAKSTSMLLGTPTYHRLSLARQVGMCAGMPSQSSGRPGIVS